jgi:molybdopterin-guanine dinucleotide biosynthesis protein A
MGGKSRRLSEKQNKSKRTVDGAQVVESLLSKHEASSSVPSTTHTHKNPPPKPKH